jgi:hypothetical protein
VESIFSERSKAEFQRLGTIMFLQLLEIRGSKFDVFPFLTYVFIVLNIVFKVITFSGRVATKFGTFEDLIDVINHSIFHVDR